MLLKTCGCGKTIPINQITCDQCKTNQKQRHKSYDKYKRDERSRAFYHGKEWRRLRKAVVAKYHGLCQMCLDKGKINPGNICHHIIEVKDDWDKRLEIDNINLVCQSCHNEIHNTPGDW